MTDSPVSDYGQVSWFERKFLAEGYRQVGAYYGYSVNGYQIFRHRFLVDLLKQTLQDKYPDSVLDVGCGVGDFINLLGKIFVPKRILGVDFVGPVAAVAAKRFPHIEFRQDSLPKLDTISEKFDLIIASEVLYYLSPSEQQEAMARLDELLNDDGRILVSSTLAPNAFSMEALQKLVQSRFVIQHQWTQNSRLYLKFIQPFVLSHKVNTTRLSDDWPALYKMVYRLFQTPVLGHLLSALNRGVMILSTPVLRSYRLAAFLTSVGNLVGPRWAGSNVIMLLHKKG